MAEEASVVEEVEIEAAGVASVEAVEDLVAIEVDLQLVAEEVVVEAVAAEGVAVEPQKLL